MAATRPERVLLLANLLYLFSLAVPANADHYENSTSPSVWIRCQADVTSLVPGASQAILSFDLRNDPPPRPGGQTACHFAFDSWGGWVLRDLQLRLRNRFGPLARCAPDHRRHGVP